VPVKPAAWVNDADGQQVYRGFNMSDAATSDAPASPVSGAVSDDYGTGPIEEFGPAPRRKSVPVQIGNVTVGGDAPIVVQSMTNTDTADIDGTVKQVLALARSGSELVRITVDRDEAAAAVPIIRERLDILGCDVPLVGDFHYIGHKLLNDHPVLRRSAGEIPHQSWQCGLQGQARCAVRCDYREGHHPR
jgi:hypothetical protein